MTKNESRAIHILASLKDEGVDLSANANISQSLKGHLSGLQTVEDATADAFQRLMDVLQIDTANDHNTRDTAKRVAKMFIHEVFKGRYYPKPDVTTFPNVKKVDELYCTGPITVRSACSHHFVPIVGRAWIGLIPGDRLIGLSKFNRLVEWVAARPQIQEEMTSQIADEIEEACQPRGLGVIIEATHMCMTWRGVRESMDAKMTTSVMRGAFRDESGAGYAARSEFLAISRR